jgi:tetratricopeptide (TPR) repeat protein
MKAYSLLLSILLGFSCLLQANTQKVDSLLTELRESEDDKARVLLYGSIASEYRNENRDTAFDYALKGYDLANKIKYDYGIAESAFTLAALYVTDNDLDKANVYYTEAAEKYRETDSLFKYTRSRMILGNIQLAHNQYFEALQLYESCLPLSLEKDFVEILPHLYNNIGVIFLDLEEYDQALPYLQKAYDIFDSANDSYNASYAASNMAFIYNSLGEDEKALDKYLAIVPIYLKQDRWTDLADLYNSIAGIYVSKQDESKAEEYISLALNILDKNRQDFSGPSSLIESRVNSTASQVEFMRGDYSTSIAYARTSLNLSMPNSYKVFVARNARLMMDSYRALGITDSALAYSNLYIQYQDSLNSNKGIKEITQLRMQSDFDSKLREAEFESIRRSAAQKKRETIYVAAVIVALLLACILILLFVNQRKKTSEATLRKEKLELEQETLRHQVDYKNKELTLNVMYLSEKNEFITMIARKLEGMKTDAKRENRHIIQQIINELQKNSDTKSWDEFEMRFMEVHAAFYDALNNAFPDLTPNEKRLCAFLRLNMTTKEVSAITYQSVQSINMARFRLRKKMNMDRDENLIAYLTKL